MNGIRGERRWFAVGVGVVAALIVVLLLTGCVGQGPTPAPAPMPDAVSELPFEAEAVRERICIRCGTADNEIRNGYDVIWYSDNGSTETATISGDSGNASFDGTVTVGGDVSFGDVTIGDNLTFANGEAIGNVPNGTLTITATTIVPTGNVDVGGDLTLEDTLTFANGELIGNVPNGTVEITATTIKAAGNLETTGTLAVQGGNITLENDNTIANGSANAVTINADVTVEDFTLGDTLTFANGESIGNVPDGTMVLTATTVQVNGAFGSTGNASVADLTLGDALTFANGELIGNVPNGTVEITATTIKAAGNLETTGTLAVQGGNITLENDNTIANGSANAVTINADVTVEDFTLGDTLTFANGESIGNVPDGTMVLTATTVQVNGAFGSTGDATVADLTLGDTLTFANGESIGNVPDGTLVLTATTVQVNGAFGSTGDATVADLTLGDTLTFANGESIGNVPDGTVEITATTIKAAGNLETTGTLDVQGGDITLENDNTIANGSANAVTINADVTVEDFTLGDTLTFANGKSIGNVPDGTLVLTATTVQVNGAFGSTGDATVADLTLGDTLTFANGESIGNVPNGTLTLTATTISAAGDISMADGEYVAPASGTNASAVYVGENTLAYTDAASKTMFIIPANANIVDFLFIVDTVFNDSGTDQINCGISPNGADTDDYVDDLDGEAAGINRMGDAGDMVIGGDGDVGASNVTVACHYDGQNENASAGAATLRVFYRVD